MSNKRAKQKFNGTLNDEELYYIEDGLELLKIDKDKVLVKSQQNKIEKLILKLYQSFSETK